MRLLPPLLCTCAVTFILTASADEKPQDFIDRLPNLPEESCQVKAEVRNAYLQSLAEFRKPLDKELDRRRLKEREQMRTMQKAAPKLTKEQKKALADKYLEEKLGITREEVDRLKTMSKEGKQAWAKSVATENLAASTTESAKAEQDRSSKMYTLFKDAQRQQTEFIAAAKLYGAKFAGLEKEFRDEQEKHELDEKAEAKQREESGDSSPPPRHNYNYCGRYTPKYRAIAADFRNFVLGVVPACQQLEALQYQMLKAQIEQGNAQVDATLQAPIPPEPTGDGGAAAFGVIHDYLQVLEGSYRYDIDPPPESGNS